MGFIKAFTGAISETFADQWKEYYIPRQSSSSTVAVFEATKKSTNNDVGQNTKGSENVISNDSKIVVPEGMALVTIQDGAVTGFIAEPGGYIYRSDDPNSRSIFAGDGLIKSTIGQTWERFKFGGIPGVQQLLFYVNLKTITGITFGTQETIYWNDTFFGTKIGAMVRGTYSLKIVDPLLFIKQFLPVSYLQPNAKSYDLGELSNDHAEKALFEPFCNCLKSAFARLSYQARTENIDTMEYVQMNAAAFTTTMSAEVENIYHWQQQFGLEIVNVSMEYNYDQKTQDLLDEIRKDDIEVRKTRNINMAEVEKQTMMGQAYANNMAGMMASASGDAMKAAAGNENGAMMGFMGMNLANMQANNLMGSTANLQQPQTPNAEDPYAKLAEMKKLLDAGVITPEDFEAVKKQILGI